MTYEYLLVISYLLVTLLIIYLMTLPYPLVTIDR